MSARGWNLADVFETIADSIPDAPAATHADHRYTWREFDQRADGVAAALLAAGLREQDKVAQYLYNTPEYIESVFAAFKAGMATVNTNYRYVADELVYLWDNADVVAVVFHGSFCSTIDTLRHRVPNIVLWLWVDDGSGPCPQWATPYEQAATNTTGRTCGPWGRSADHLFLLYTGGTTGLPKGVMWRQDDLFRSLDASNRNPLPAEQNLAEVARRRIKPGPRTLPAAPLMHGTGLFTALSNLLLGGSIVTLPSRRFDPTEILDTIQHERINAVSLVGDAFAKPLVDMLDAFPDRWDISSLRVMVSSGVMWSQPVKTGVMRHCKELICVDMLGSSEAIGVAANVSRGSKSGDTARFVPGPNTRVLNEAGTDVVPGSGERGRIAIRGFTPLGYYKDPAKSASTFVDIDAERYSIPGDWAEVLVDGTIALLGRGSQCINTGGEKVYPEEVEECLKLHPLVVDAAVVGVPHPRFGQAIWAVCEIAEENAVDAAALIAHVKARMAAYKAPKGVLPVGELGRAPNGKLDYRALTALVGDPFDASNST